MTREPWICPSCGRTLTVRNQEHVCGLYDLEGHFERRDPLGRVTFEWMSSVFESVGPIDVLPMKTTIAFARGVNIAFLKTKRSGADVSVVLSRPLGSPRVAGEVVYSRTKTIYRIPIFGEAELDSELRAWLVEAYL